MLNELESRLKGSLRAHVFQELLTNSIHFPLANIILELLLRPDHPSNYFLELDPYVIMTACFVQASFLGRWEYEGRGFRFWGNLIGPAFYTTFELIAEGTEFFESPNHIAYWIFSLILGFFQRQEYYSTGGLRNLYILLEHLVRTNILLVCYWIFEASHDRGYPSFDPKYTSLPGFLSDHSHQYIAIVLFLLGLVIGFANITAANYLRMLKETAKTLRKYSEWFFGRELLSQAVVDASVLTLHRRERTVLFMDIRGFTRWSERKSPEEVVQMLNAYFSLAETSLEQVETIKVKHTGDEVLAVFPDTKNALGAAMHCREAIGTFLRQHALSAGIGVHSGPLVEGLIGSTHVKAYDIIGDTVNTGKRICDKAAGGEILVSKSCYEQLAERLIVSETRAIAAKGKQETLQVYRVQDFISDPAPPDHSQS